MKQHNKRLRDTWQKLTNISPLAAQLPRWTWRAEVQHPIANHQDEPLQARICSRAELWSNSITRRGFGYGNGNRAKRRSYRLWQEGRITAAQLLDADMQLL